MSRNVEISATIVLYKNGIEIVQKTIDNFLELPISKKLYLIDNSPSNILQKHFSNPNIEYKFVGKNSGFSKAHNLILEELKNNSKYHLILNPDVVFEPEDIPKLIQELEKEEDVVMIAPKVIYPNGKMQYTCRKHPTFLELIYRRLGIKKEFTQQQEYRNLDLTKPFYPEFIHGCFMLFKTTDFINLNGFDERYFLYLEDADICREIEAQQKRIRYFSEVTIQHQHQKGSSKNIMLLLYHFSSALKYFKKWKN